MYMCWKKGRGYIDPNVIKSFIVKKWQGVFDLMPTRIINGIFSRDIEWIATILPSLQNKFQYIIESLHYAKCIQRTRFELKMHN